MGESWLELHATTPRQHLSSKEGRNVGRKQDLGLQQVKPWVCWFEGCICHAVRMDCDWHVCECVCVCQSIACVLLFFSLPYFLRQGPLLNLKLTNSPSLIGQQARGTLCTSVLGLEVCTTVPSFYVGAGDVN